MLTRNRPESLSAVRYAVEGMSLPELARALHRPLAEIKARARAQRWAASRRAFRRDPSSLTLY